MDIDSQHGDSDESRHSGVLGCKQDPSDGSETLKAQRRRQGSSDAQQKPTRRAQNYSEQKWMLLQKSYHDGYAELLRSETTESLADGIPAANLEQSQIGAVTWRPSEKEALYQALSRKGLRDLPQLAHAVNSKSLPEIQEFLLLLHEKQSERHLLHRQTKTISHTDIPAAIETSIEIEEALENAADAQLAYEDYYAHVAGAQNGRGLWIIDSEAAEELDTEHFQAGEVSEELSEEVGGATFETPIFHVSKFVELSERLFMNYGRSHTHENWRDVAMGRETPAMTQEVISDLYDLVVSFARKLIQTSIFLAQSRQRATTSNHYTHRSMVREQDVAAAIDILNLKCDLWEFWVGVPRRNKLDVLDDKHKRGGYGRGKYVPYDAVEQILRKRKARWRGRRRSTSAGTEASLTEEEAFETTDQLSQDEDTESLSSANQGGLPSDNDELGILEAHPLDAILDVSSSDEQQDDSSDHPQSTDSSSENSSDDFSGLNSHIAGPRQKDRRLDLEERQDAYLDQIDAEVSRREEIRLWEMLGYSKPAAFKSKIDKDSANEIRPKVMRKSIDELTNSLASTNYSAEWELFGAMVPNDSFLKTERARKRSRTMPKNMLTKAETNKTHLPFRARILSTDTGESADTESTKDS